MIGVIAMKNLVAKYMRKYNKSVKMKNRKKDYSRKGKSKWVYKDEQKD